MLNPNANMRPTTFECLSHEWFRGDREALKNLLSMNKSSTSFQFMTLSLYDDGNQANTPLYFEGLRKTLETKMTTQDRER